MKSMWYARYGEAALAGGGEACDFPWTMADRIRHAGDIVDPTIIKSLTGIAPVTAVWAMSIKVAGRRRCHFL